MNYKGTLLNYENSSGANCATCRSMSKLASLQVKPAVSDINDKGSDGYPASADGNNSLAVGLVATEAARVSNDSSVKSVLSPGEFASAAKALQVGLGVQAQADAKLRVYKPSTCAWADFAESMTDTLASAPLAGGECPPASSHNYSAGLAVAKACARIQTQDGGSNDAEGERDGVIGLVAAVGTPLNDGDGPELPDEVNSTESKGSGSINLGALMLLCLWLMGLLITRRRMQ